MTKGGKNVLFIVKEECEMQNSKYAAAVLLVISLIARNAARKILRRYRK